MEEHTGDNTALTTQGCSLGAPDKRPQLEEEDWYLKPTAKKTNYQVPSMEVCLGKENWQKLREEELKIAKASTVTTDVGEETHAAETIQLPENKDTSSRGQNMEKGAEPTEGTNKEATSNVAAGQLTGTKERAHQEQ